MGDASIGRKILSVCIVGTALSAVACSNEVAFDDSDPDSQRVQSGNQIDESFTQGFIAKKLDVLFVVDNSGSMAEEQNKMGERIRSFLSTLHDVDWQIGITTTDISEGPYATKGDLVNFHGTQSYVLSKKIANYEDIFRKTIARQESINCGNNCASGDEQPIQAALLSILKKDTANKGFFRSNSDLGIVILSDEDEMSNAPRAATTPNMFLQAVNGIWGDSKKLLSYAMVIEPGDAQCLGEQVNGGAYGTYASELSRLTGGLTGSICEEDYGVTLGVIGDNARQLLEYFKLKYYPIPESIEVSYLNSAGSLQRPQWRLDGKRLFLQSPPPKGTVIQVTYTVK